MKSPHPSLSLGTVTALLTCLFIYNCAGGSAGSSVSGADSTPPSDPVAIATSHSTPVNQNAQQTRGSGVAGSLSPGDLRVHYNFPTQYTGAGQAIAIVVAPGSSNPLTDLNAFSRYYNLPQCTSSNPCFNMIDLSKGAAVSPSNDWAYEIALDTQWAHAMAPQAQIILVLAKSSNLSDLMAAVNTAVSQKNVVAVSMSWGAYEFTNEITLAYDGLFALYPNIAFIASSGDTGDNGHNQLYPAASPFVTAVGGTSIHSLNLPITSTTETAWSLGGGGPSSFEMMPYYQSSYLLASNDTAVLGANGRKRAIPDVAYNSDPNVSPVAINVKGLWYGVGGTSAGAPQWAAIMANFAQYLQAKGISYAKLLSNYNGLNGVLYQTKLDQNNAYSFFDVTSGSNNTSSGICILCTASKGYDDVTGLGVPNVGIFFGHF